MASRPLTLGNWSMTAQLMRDAIRFQPGKGDLVTQVRIYGVRFEPYAPYTYLALASLELKDWRERGLGHQTVRS